MQEAARCSMPCIDLNSGHFSASRATCHTHHHFSYPPQGLCLYHRNRLVKPFWRLTLNSVSEHLPPLRHSPLLQGFCLYHKKRLVTTTSHKHTTAPHSPLTPATSPPLPMQGFCLYHKNRLVKPFWRVYSSSTVGRGVVGYLEADFVQPTPDWQDFERR